MSEIGPKTTQLGRTVTKIVLCIYNHFLFTLQPRSGVGITPFMGPTRAPKHFSLTRTLCSAPISSLFFTLHSTHYYFSVIYFSVIF